MVKVTKEIKIEIDGKDFEALVNVCEACRILLGHSYQLFLPSQLNDMQELIRQVFDAAEREEGQMAGNPVWTWEKASNVNGREARTWQYPVG